MPYKIPDELMRNDRPTDQDFDPEERLYIRFKKLIGGKPDVSQIQTNQSANRSKYCSNPEWVLINEAAKFSGWSYGYVTVENSTFDKRSGPPASEDYFFAPWHEPTNTNYSHTEIQAFKDIQKTQRFDRLSKKVKTDFRVYLRNQFVTLEIGEDTEVLDD